MVKSHIKRISAPKSWPISRKFRTWVTRPKPGRPFALAISLNNTLKELTEVVRTSKEAKYLLKEVGVEINGKRVYSIRQPVGFMDVVSISSQDKHWRVGLTKKGRLCAIPISKEEASQRLVKIKNKTRVGSSIQINCSDGTNMLVSKNTYAIGDTLLLEKNKIKKHLPLTKGASIILTSGGHLSEVGVVSDLGVDTIYFEHEGEIHSTARRCAFVVGTKEPEVTLQ
jgi:small subunit ribosomal protein S4e